MQYSADAVIFDLDGTLIASLEDLADAANMALEAHGLPTHPVEAFAYFVGDGMETMIRRAVPPGTPADVEAAVFAMGKREYGSGWARKTCLYPGIAEMLAELERRRVPMAVLTNKPHEFTVEVMNHFFPDGAFRVIQGSPVGGKAKPEPAMALGIAQTFGLDPARVAFMGDSRTDMDTAVNAGMLPVGVLWGFRPEQELLDHGARVILGTPLEFFVKVRLPG